MPVEFGSPPYLFGSLSTENTKSEVRKQWLQREVVAQGGVGVKVDEGSVADMPRNAK